MEGTSDKLGRGMLVLPMWGVYKPVKKTAIVGLSEGATTTRDNLPTVGTIRTNGSPSALNTEVDMGHHMGMLRPISVTPTNSSVMALSKPVRIAIIGLRERATTIQDKLLTVETTRTNGLLRTKVAIGHHLDKLRVMSGVTPTNNKAMAASGAMK
jgi:hypothetical protein